MSFGGKSVSKGLAKGREIESVYFVLCALRKADPRAADLRAAGLWWRDEDGWCAKLPAAEALKKAAELSKNGIPARCAPALPSKAPPKSMAASKRSG